MSNLLATCRRKMWQYSHGYFMLNFCQVTIIPLVSQIDPSLSPTHFRPLNLFCVFPTSLKLYYLYFAYTSWWLGKFIQDLIQRFSWFVMLHIKNVKYSFFRKMIWGKLLVSKKWCVIKFDARFRDKLIVGSI